MIGHIYKIENPSGKIYIGKTTNMNTRMNKYRYLNCNNQKRLHSSLLKYGWNAHTVDVIDTVLIFDDNLDILEKYYIDHYDSYRKGLNCTLGGEGVLGILISEETRNKMRSSATGKKQSAETIEKRVNSLRGQKRSQEFRELRRQYRTGVVMSDETKKKLRQCNLGKPSPNRIQCRLINLQTNEIWEADSMIELSKVSPLSMATLVRLKAGRTGKKVKSTYNLEYN